MRASSASTTSRAGAATSTDNSIGLQFWASPSHTMFSGKGAGHGQPPVQYGGPQRLAPGQAQPDMANTKTPPSWTPELESSYPLWVYVQDLILWSAATEVPVARQGPAAALQLGGMARVLGREMSVDELANGRQEWDYAQQQMVQVTGITILLRNLLRRFGELDEEQGIRLLSQLLGFTRVQGETIDQALSRFDIT
eukprot:6320654-Pyramimonas_sp.AAC.1